MLLAFAVNEAFGVDLFHGRSEDADMVLIQRFEETIAGLSEPSQPCSNFAADYSPSASYTRRQSSSE
jgi:hypothetical protein